MKSLARAGDKAEVLRRLRAVTPESPRRWGRMSAPQMVCHLSDAFRCVIGRRPVSHASTLLWRTAMKWIALYLPLPWPEGKIRTRPEIDQLLGGTKPSEFASDVADLEALVELVTSHPPRTQWCEHPLFGRMSEAEWLRWGYLHMDHHLRQFGA